jgi:hypothetical protein
MVSLAEAERSCLVSPLEDAARASMKQRAALIRYLIRSTLELSLQNCEQ